MARNYTKELLAAQAAGKVIKAGHYATVIHQPRNDYDPKPWTDGEYRYDGRDCWPEAPAGECVDAEGNEYPEHSEDELECRRCGAELESRE